MKLRILLTAALSAGTALAPAQLALAFQLNPDVRAESPAQPESSSTPVALLYVARPTHVDGFSVASNGKLIAVPGSPFSNIALSHLSVTKKYLFGPGNDGKNLYSYSIASNGSLKLAHTLNAQHYNNQDDCGGIGPTTLDATGTNLYNVIDPECEVYIQSYKIESDGALQYLGSVDTGTPGDLFGVSNLTIPGNNKYAFQSITGGDSFPGSGVTEYKRESNGALALFDYIDLPNVKNPDDTYVAEYAMASDSSDHFALVLSPVDDGFGPDGPDGIATYTVSSSGKATTESTYKNMPTDKVVYASAISISPSGKLLVVGGNKGFQLFHYNGGSQATKYSSALQTGAGFFQFAWDKDNHLFALGDNGKVYVYNVTTSSITEASGSPYSIPEAASLIVLSK
jgi:hypothetical protein